MSLFKGALTVRRYRVLGAPPDDFRSVYPQLLQERAFHEPMGMTRSEEIEGWVLTQNLLDTDFSNQEKWLYNQYLAAALRVDKKTLPARLVKAMLEKRIKAWCEEHRRERAPASVRTELKELLEDELYGRTLPRVAVFEFCWNLVENWVIYFNTSEGPNDRFRKRFRDTFGLPLVPFSPLDLLEDRPDLSQGLEITGLSDLRPGAEERA